MRMEFAGKSDIGLKREINQDAICAFQKDGAGLFAVADGMGGHRDGEKASRKVIEVLSDWWNLFSPVLYKFDFRKMMSSIGQAIEYANKRIYGEWGREGICGTTVTVLFLYGNFYGVLYAGDSRCYLGYGKRWEQITVDEVWENQPGLSEQDRRMKNHPNRGMLSNAVGVRENIQYRVITDYALSGAVFVLCTDGLYKFCPDKVIRNYARQGKGGKEIKKAVEELMARVYGNGAGDNVSIVIVKCYEG